MTGPCNWTVTPCDTCCTDAIAALPPSYWETLKQWAAAYLWRATGKRFGLCEVAYRPCKRECGEYWGGLPYPVRIAGEWVNLSCGTCLHGCQCSAVSEVVIENVYSVKAVRIDGVDLTPVQDHVAVYDNRRIVRTDGGQWPSCQDLNVTDGIGAWSITVLQGEPVPPGGDIVAGILACELAKACLGDSGCRLPRRVQTITRESVTVGFQDQFENLADLRVGLWEVDSWLEAARSVRWREPSILSPDWPEPSELTWPRPLTAPVVGSVSPATGPAVGGNTVTIFGSGFSEGL